MYNAVRNLLTLQWLCDVNDVDLHNVEGEKVCNLGELLTEARKVFTYLGDDAGATMRYLKHVLDLCPEIENLVLYDADTDTDIDFWNMYWEALKEVI